MGSLDWLTRDAMQMLRRQLVFLDGIGGRIIRVRRRGFRADVKRGDDVPWSVSSDGKASVIRRSRHSLWLEIDRPPSVPIGNTIQVRVPPRYR